MKVTQISIAILVTVVCACQAGWDDGGRIKWVTIDSAYSFNIWKSTFLYLFCGNDVQILKDDKPLHIIKASNILIPVNFTVQAAFVSDKQNVKRFYYGEKYGLSVDEGTENRNKIRYGYYRKPLQNGGPDAAGRKHGRVFFFKGCHMFARRGWKGGWGSRHHVHSIGLPCHVDAAWSENGGMVVLKGDQIWRWQKDGPVNAPTPFNETYSLMDNWVLKPSPENAD